MRILQIISFIIAIAGGCAGEAAYWFLPENTGLRTACKAVTVAGILVYAICCRKRKGRSFVWIISALVLACIADVIIVTSFPIGAVLFALAHICLIILFFRKGTLSRKCWILWGIVSAVLIALILIFGSGMGIYAYGAAIYAPILLLMVFSAGKQKGLIRIAAYVFFASDLLLALYQWKHIHPLVHVIYMVLFYAALLILAGCTDKETI